MPRNRRTLVLLAHPDPAGSRANGALTDAVRDLDGVTVRDLAAVHGTDGFDVAEEQRLLVEHDLVVLRFPWCWYSVPGILKEWMDQVLLHGYAYGSGGTELHGVHHLDETALAEHGTRYRALLAGEELRVTA